MEDKSTLVCIVGVQASKHLAKLVERELYDTDVAKANSLLRPDGEKQHMFSCLPNMINRKLPTKLGSSKLSPAG